jgi:hypothetical protein
MWVADALGNDELGFQFVSQRQTGRHRRHASAGCSTTRLITAQRRRPTFVCGGRTACISRWRLTKTINDLPNMNALFKGFAASR